MTAAASRLNRDVWSETSVSDRDVSTQRHAQTVTFTRGPSLLSVTHPHPTGDPDPMKYLESLAWLECTALGCDTGRAVDSRHLDNINASGGWTCPEHESENAR